jgi:dienelactone hydrolase
MRCGSSVVRVLMTIAAVAAVVAASLWGSVARPGGGHPQLVVSASSALADQSVRVRVTGLLAGQQVTIVSSARDYTGPAWQGRATFDADTAGIVDLGMTAPSDGTYRGVDPMGLLWSMNPVPGPANTLSFSARFPQLAPYYQVRLTVYVDEQPRVSTMLTRRWLAPGVRHPTLTLAREGMVGDLFLPPPGAQPRPAVLAFGGSEGGQSQNFTAALLASHGYPALSLGYFHLPGLPTNLADIPLEYFAAAARLLAEQPGVDPGHILAMGDSRGSEAALLLADEFPSLIHGAVLYAPSAVVNSAFPVGAGPAWTLAGRPVPLGPIPVAHISGPVMAIAGVDDMLWPSPTWATQINDELSQAHIRYPHRALIYPYAGHGVGGFPYLPTATRPPHPITGTVLDLGGTRPGDEAAQQAGWNAVLTLLAASIR